MYKKRILLFTTIVISLGICVFITFSASDTQMSGMVPKLILLFVLALSLIALQFFFFSRTQQEISDDIEIRIDMVNAKNQIIDKLSNQGYVLDMSVDSLKEIDRFLNHGSISVEEQGRLIYGLGVYFGQVVIDATGGEWKIEHLPTGIELRVVIGEISISPVIRVTEKYHHGPDDSLYAYFVKEIAK